MSYFGKDFKDNLGFSDKCFYVVFCLAIGRFFVDRIFRGFR